MLAGAVLWGTTGTAQALAPPGASPLAVGAVRLVIAGAVMTLVAGGRGVGPWRRTWPIASTMMAALGVAGYQLCFFEAVRRTGVAVGTVVAIGSAPILAGLLGHWVHGERPGWRWMLATALAVAGCGLLSGNGRSLHADPVGLALALGAGAAYALYSVLAKRLLEQHPPDAVMALIFAIGALMLTPVLLASNLRWLGAVQGAAVALHLGVVATAAAYFLYARGLALIASSRAVTLALAEPLTASILGVCLLGERLTLTALGGMVLLLLGLVTLAGSDGVCQGGTDDRTGDSGPRPLACEPRRRPPLPVRRRRHRDMP